MRNCPVLHGQFNSQQVRDLDTAGLHTLADYAHQWWTYVGEWWKRPFERVVF